MIKIHAHFGRKVPGDAQYSSQQASASIDFEISDSDVTNIRQKLAGAWTMLRSAVDAELNQQSRIPETNRIAQYDDFQTPSNGNGNGNYQNQPQSNDLQNPFGGGNGQRVQQANGVQQNHQVASTQRGASNNGNGHQNPNGYQNNNGNGAHSLNHHGNGQSAPHSLTSYNVGENATKKQIGYLFATARRTQNWNANQTKDWVANQCGCDFNAITKQQASDLIEVLLGKK